ncbi:MAG: hypothetical protein GXP41_09895 [Chloroflexi bacterium]|nr:hypothetical protein [Chloroflexota bacterium]
MSRAMRLQLVPRTEKGFDADAFSYLPYGAKTMKLVVLPGDDQLPDSITFRPAQRHADQNLVIGYPDGDRRDLWVVWGGGKTDGQRVQLDKDERYVYFDIIHREPGIPASRDLTIVGMDAGSGQEVLRQTFRIVKPGDGEKKWGHFSWQPLDGNHSELRFSGKVVPEYISRWWPTRGVTYRPLPKKSRRAFEKLRLNYTRLLEGHSFGRVSVFWGDSAPPLMQVDGRLEVSLHDARLFSAELYHLAGDRFYVLRLWFRWLYKHFSAEDLLTYLPQESQTEGRRKQALADALHLNGLLKRALREEIPDAERFDVVLDVENGQVRYVGTDLHWQELWGPAPEQRPVQARILPFGLQNLAYTVVTGLQAKSDSAGRDEFFSPAEVIRKWATQGFPGQRGLGEARVIKFPLPFQAHVPKYDGVRFLDTLISGNVRRSRPMFVAREAAGERAGTPAPKAQWTVMVYMAGDNGILLAEPMEAAGYEDLKEMKQAGSTDDVHVLAQFDTKGDRKTYRYRLRAGTTLKDDLVQTIPETNTGDLTNLVDFIVWAMQTYPAEKTLLILWNHGNGWDDEDLYAGFRAVKDRLPVDKAETRAIAQKSRLRHALFRSTLTNIPQEAVKPGRRGILYDDSSMDFLDNRELKEALRQAVQQTGLERIDILGMDACLMAMLEVVYQVRDTCRYVVASEEAEPMRGWPYDLFLGALTRESKMDARTAAKEAVTRYVQSYDKGAISPDITLSALDMVQLPDSIAALDQLALAILGRLHEMIVFEAVATARRKAQRFQKDGYIDLGHFLRLLQDRLPEGDALRSTAQAVRDTLSPGKAVLAAQTAGRGVEHAEGVAIYFPEQGTPEDDGITALYAKLDFAADCHWADFLTHYHATRKAYYERRTLPQWSQDEHEAAG